MFRRVSISTLALLAAMMVLYAGAGPAPAQTQYEAIELPPSDGAFQDYYGRSVSLSDDVALIGADYDDDAGADAGSVYVYRYDGDDWVYETKLTASDAAPDDHFGCSVGVDGDVAVVGAHRADDPVGEAGSAYVFRHNGTTWIEEAEFTGTNPIDWLGYSVAVSGNLLAIGAIEDTGDGYVRVFRHDGTSWVQEAQLTGSLGLPGHRDWCGCAVALDGDVLVFGSELYNGGTCMGAAYIFRHDGTSWNEEAALVNPDAENAEWFGHSVSVRGDVVVVGAYRDGDLGLNSGSASIYRYSAGSWVHEAKLTASDGGAEERFGASVGVQGDVVVIGATGAHSEVNSFTGQAYLFRREAGNWVERNKLAASDGLPHELFGNSVSISGKRTLIGAHSANGAGAWSGSAYVFGVPCPDSGASGNFCDADAYPNNGDGVWNNADDGDCVIDIGDLGQMLGNYGATSGATREDGDVYPPGSGDGAVDISDIGQLLAQYGDNCN